MLAESQLLNHSSSKRKTSPGQADGRLKSNESRLKMSIYDPARERTSKNMLPTIAMIRHGKDERKSSAKATKEENTMPLSVAEKAIHEKIRAFQSFLAKGEWKELVETCYAPSASLTHFVASNPLVGRASILQFFQANDSGYALDLRYTIAPLESDSGAHLVAGVGKVGDKKAWCPFVERWEKLDSEWLIVQDRVYSPEEWME